MAHTCTHNQAETRKVLQDFLPPDYDYQVTFFEITKASNILCENQFNATLNLNICTTEDAYTFLGHFNSVTDVSYKMDKGDHINTKLLILSGARVCIRNIRKRKKSGNEEEACSDKTVGKNTNCMARIKFKLKKYSHSPDCKAFSLQLDIEHQHNHPIESARNVRLQPVSNDTRHRFLEYFDLGHSASSAYHANKSFWRAKYKDDYTRISANRSYSPDYDWVFNLSAKYNLGKFGKMLGPEAMQKAQEHAEKYNLKHKKGLCHVVQNEDGHFYIIILDPLTLRVHQMLPSSGDIALLDATSNLDRVDSKLFRFLTVSPSGGLPLGQIVTSSEQEGLLTSAFSAFQEMLPPESWYGRGVKGAFCFLTDDCQSEINAIRNVWSKAKTQLKSIRF